MPKVIVPGPSGQNRAMGTVLISGCSSGIGLATAEAFGRRGHTVLAGVRRADAIAEVEERCVGLDVQAVRLDVTSGPSIEAAVGDAVHRHGSIDVLVNNAGIGAIAPLESTPEEVYRLVFETNVFGPMALIRASLPHMRHAGRGTIVNVGSVLGRVSIPFQSVYCATKFAIEALTDAVHLEVAPFGIRVCVVEPGRIPTSFATNLVGPDHRSGRTTDSPYGPLIERWTEGWAGLPGRERLATAEEVATAVVAATEAEPDGDRHLPVGDDSTLLIEQREERGVDGIERHLRTTIGYPPAGSGPSAVAPSDDPGAPRPLRRGPDQRQ